MTATRTRTVGLLTIVCVAVLGLTIAPIASGAVGVAIDKPESVSGSESNEPQANASVSSFMQSTAADAEYAVESGMFDAQYERTDDDRRADLVSERIDHLEAKAEALEAEREELREEAAEADNSAKYQARLTRLTVEISGLERAIDRTEQRAAETGVEDDRFATLEANTAALAGPDITERAQGLAGFDRHPGAGNGPPSDRGAAGSEGEPGQNGTPPGQGANEAPGQGGEQSNADSSGPGQGDQPPAAGNGNDRAGGQEPRSGADTGPDRGSGSDTDSTGNSPDESPSNERSNQNNQHDDREERDAPTPSNGQEQNQGPPTEADEGNDSSDGTANEDDDDTDPAPGGPPEHANR